MRTIFLLILIVLLSIGCNNSKKTKADSSSSMPKKENNNDSSGYAPINGLKMYFEMHGKGAPLVLIHGGGSTIQTSFSEVLPFFAKSRKVIAVELQGHGHTTDRESPESFEQDADDVAELLKYLKIEKADFFGFSNGGNTTMQIAIRHPALVRKIILGSAFYKREGMYPWFWESMKNATLENMPQGLKDAYKKVAPDSNDLINMFTKDRNRMVEFKDWKDEDIRSIKVPAFIIVGDKDVVRPEHAVEMFRLLPNAKLTILPGAHGEYIGEVEVVKKGSKVPELTVSMIKEFLNEPMPDK